MSNLFLKEAIPVTEQNWADDIQPVVSVFNWSYNHVNFIRQSIESILEQKTTFPIEIIIHDDASNDGTIEIIREYESKYPQLFRNIIQKENQWSQGKSVMDPLFKVTRGKYIALTHGDDYWTDPLKLQKQVDFLEQNEDYALCAHIVEEKNEIANSSHFFPNTNKEITLKIEDYILNNHTGTCSLLFESKYIKPIPVWFQNISFGDLGLILTVLHRSKKKLLVLKDVMGLYRVHERGIHGSLKKNNKSLIIAYKMHIDFIKVVNKELFQKKEYSKEVKLKLILTYKKLSELSKSESWNQFSYFFLKQMWFRILLKIEKLKFIV